MTQKLLIYGTTGYTGDLIAREAVKQGLKPIIAGRNEAKLKEKASAMNVEYRAFALDDPQHIQAMLKDVDVVLNAAGPFAVTAVPLVEACLATQTHYLDIAGEVPEFERLYGYHEQAQSADVMIMAGVGFGIVPTDCMALHLKQHLPSATHLTLAFQVEGGVSRGTMQTLLKDIYNAGVKRQAGELVTAKPAEKSLKVDAGAGETTFVTNPWRGDIFTAYHTTNIPNIETYIAVPAPLRWLMKNGKSVGWLLSSPPIQFLIKRLPEGPSAKQLQRGKSFIWGEVRDDAGQTYSARLVGPDAYIFTALAALAIVKEIFVGNAPSGFQTPASAYGTSIAFNLPNVQIDDV